MTVAATVPQGQARITLFGQPAGRVVAVRQGHDGDRVPPIGGGTDNALVGAAAGGVPVEAEHRRVGVESEHGGELGLRELLARLGDRTEVVGLARADCGSGDGHGIERPFDHDDPAVGVGRGR